METFRHSYLYMDLIVVFSERKRDLVKRYKGKNKPVHIVQNQVVKNGA